MLPQNQINFTGNLGEPGNILLTVFIIEDIKETILEFSQRTMKVL